MKKLLENENQTTKELKEQIKNLTKNPEPKEKEINHNKKKAVEEPKILLNELELVLEAIRTNLLKKRVKTESFESVFFFK